MPNDEPTALGEQFAAFRETFERLRREIQKVIVGHDALITDCLTALFCQGHVLLEGVPGLGKTHLVKVIADVLDVQFGRIQCTPDLMPTDILGTHIIQEDDTGTRTFRYEKGPVFSNVLLVDEINRATPKTQAALLEVMQEQCVTASGEHFTLPSPFFVLATQNPLEMEGTYPLPEAQLDRFLFKLDVAFPGHEELVEISRRTTRFAEPQVDSVMTGSDLLAYQELLTGVPIADALTSYAASVILATHPDHDSAPERVKRYVAYGASPRGLQALVRGARVHTVLANRTAVAIEDIHRVASQALRHRLILNFEGQAESLAADELIQQVLENVPTPARG